MNDKSTQTDDIDDCYTPIDLNNENEELKNEIKIEEKSKTIFITVNSNLKNLKIIINF